MPPQRYKAQETETFNDAQNLHNSAYIIVERDFDCCKETSAPSISYDPQELSFSGERAFAIEDKFVTTFTNRHSGTNQSRLATEWLWEQFTAAGWTCKMDDWEIINYSQPVSLSNVVCRLPGKDANDPREILVVAHHDQASTTIQGADNDGSGIAILLHLAEIFASEGPPKYTLVFVADDAEEYGMVGSRRYIQTHPNTENIIAGLSLDNLGRDYYDSMAWSRLFTSFRVTFITLFHHSSVKRNN